MKIEVKTCNCPPKDFVITCSELELAYITHLVGKNSAYRSGFITLDDSSIGDAGLKALGFNPNRLDAYSGLADKYCVKYKVRPNED